MINDGAIYHPDDNSYVFQDEQGRAHRESGPAHINNDYMEYRQHGNLHNLEGPAFIEFENKKLESMEKMHRETLEFKREQNNKIQQLHITYDGQNPLWIF